MDTKKKSVFWWTGVVLIGLAVFLIGLNIFYLAKYDKVEGELYITKKGTNNRTQVYVTYEYDGKLYEERALSVRNLFTMKDGKKYNVYINPNDPEWPKCVDFSFTILSIIFGVMSLKVDGMDKPKNKPKDYSKDSPWLK